MSQRILVNPKTNEIEIAEVLMRAGKPVAILFSTHSIENVNEVNNLCNEGDKFNRTLNNKGLLNPF